MSQTLTEPAPVKAEPKRCKSVVKDDNGREHPCDTVLPKGQPECRNRKRHMYTFKTGFCASGFCEGKEAKDFKGNYVRTCPYWQYCNCQCHKDIDKMYLMAEMDRVLIENPKYVKPHNPYWMPNRGLDFGMQDEVTGDAAPKSETIPAPISPLEAKPKHFVETPTGKRARGQLEQQVLDVCTAFTKGQIEVEDLTPTVIANEIDEIEPPSVGAIGAVFDRWVALGFARCEKKPVRFISFTVDGLMYGLDHLKAKAKREQKRVESDKNKGIRR